MACACHIGAIWRHDREGATGREAYRELAPIALEFARDLLETVDTADRAALDRALIKLTERSAKLAPRIANGRRPG